MGITLQIKKSTASTAPSSLENGELAYTHGAGTQGNNGKRFFIGDASNNVTVVGGQYFTDMMDHVHGTLTASSAIIVDGDKRIDDLIVGISSTAGGSIKLREAGNNGTSTTSIKGAAALSGDITFTLPNAVADGSFMMSNASGTLSNTTFNTTGGAGTADFAVSGNVVSLSPTPSAFQAITVDNIKLGDADAQTISTSSGDLKLSPAGNIDAASNVIENVGTPVNATDAANKGYVDGQLQGLDIKESVRVATTANGTLATAFANGQTVGGVSVATGDRILLKDQSTATENGVYTVNASGAPTRATDFDSSTDVTAGAFVFVEEGSNADQGFVLTNNGTITIGSTSLSFTQFSGAGNLNAGDGLTKTGSQIDAVGTANRISVGANSIDSHASYAGQTSITTLGTIATGVWNATAIGATKGGTGLTTIPKGSILVANTEDTLTALDGGGSSDKIAIYDYNNDTWGVSNSLDGGTF